ncbi:hypothetical protein ABVV53_02555 [Novosphingobium sp. RD2P27]|uniref:Flagellar basal body-associated protein FliL n=1 Tax=Novosphingobium kalidii TaxID=3230299 RepID=A0ABV2CXM3_9SPHN
MKRIFRLLALLTLGLAVGGGAAYATSRLLGPPPAHEPADSAFVPTGPLLAPLVFEDGRLSGYVTFEIQLEVPSDQVEFVTARMPLLLHAVNLRTFRSPLASGPDGMLPNLEQFRKIVMEAAPEAFGEDVVRHAAITQANPA